jgi:hypothetical protein
MFSKAATGETPLTSQANRNTIEQRILPLRSMLRIKKPIKTNHNGLGCNMKLLSYSLEIGIPKKDDMAKDSLSVNSSMSMSGDEHTKKKLEPKSTRLSLVRGQTNPTLPVLMKMFLSV